MNILHISTFLQGGAGRVITSLITEQIRAGHDVSLVLNETEYDGYQNYSEYLNSLENLNVAVYTVDSIFKRDEIRNHTAAKRVHELLVSNAIDVVHSHTAIASRVAMIARALLTTKHKIPVLQTMHGWGQNKTASQTETDVAILNEIDQVIAISETAKKFMVKLGVRQSNIHVIYNGIEPATTASHRLLETLFEDKSLVIGCIGSVCERKNQQLIIAALANLPRAVRDKLSVCLIGELNDAYPIKELAANHQLQDSIQFLGYQDHPIGFYQQFDWIVTTSLSEGGPTLVLMEALREGVAILASNIPEHREKLEVAEAALFFESNDVTDLSNSFTKLLSLSDDVKTKLITNGQHLFSETFTLDVMIDNYQKSYQDLIVTTD